MCGYEHGQPELVRLGDFLREQLASESIDLEPIRRLVPRMVQTSGRHTKHGELPPEVHKHPCTRGKAGDAYCRYGFPHALVDRDMGLPVVLSSDRMANGMPVSPEMTLSVAVTSHIFSWPPWAISIGVCWFIYML